MIIVCALVIGTHARTVTSLVEQAPAKAATVNNPLENDDRARLAGAKLYERECLSCHGVNRKGTRKAPALDSREVREASPGALFWILRNGSLAAGMPSFAHLPEPQRWQIITFLRKTPPPADSCGPCVVRVDTAGKLSRSPRRKPL
jgi:mono/diheme cytochrome c family protein